MGHFDGTYVVVVAVAVVVVCDVVVRVVRVGVADVVVCDVVVRVVRVDVADVSVDVHSSPHITGQLVLAKLLWSPSALQSDGGIRDPHSVDSLTPWHSWGA